MVNTLFQKREEHGVTCKSGGSSKQVDYIFGRHSKVKDINCKVVAGGSVERQNRMVVCRMTLVVRKMKRIRAN